ncbi:YciI family protein [Reichenbachiella sp.]|uniref:YciI family protein n=1 Tax=Reichenbachiella sp. TaxID=2184521 RepID=UPI003B5B126F
MKDYLFIFRNDESGSDQTPEEMQAHMAKWSVWMQGLAEDNKLIAGEPLQKEGKVVRNAGALITDGAYAEGKEMVGGYLIVKSDTLDGAVEISKGCPIYEDGGSVEVREIMKMEM